MADTQKKQKELINSLKFGKRMYFFDVKEATNGNRFMKVTESIFVKEGEPHRRNTMILFKDNVSDFVAKLQEVEKEL